MATVKKAQVAPTHPTVYVGLGLTVIGLLLAMYAYTGTRVYDVTFAAVALGGGVLALVGIFVSAWGRSIMASRATRARRGLITKDALDLTRPEKPAPPTVAAPEKKRRFAFGGKKQKEEKPAPGALFAFKRSGPAPVPMAEPTAAPSDAGTVRAKLRCPQCANEFVAEGVRPFQATCGACGFSATVGEA